ncbi:MAG: GntR family transcriptional regulator [Lactovum sp.]
MKAKYQEIADEIRQKIQSQEYLVDAAIPTESQLQKIYSVSRHTVRAAVDVLVNEGVLRKEKGSGTYVNALTIKKTNHKTIGVITTYMSDYIFPSIIRGIEQELSKKGYSLLLASTNNDYLREKKSLEKMIDFGVDGLIVEPTRSNLYNPNLAIYVNLKEQNIPMVMINAVYEELDIPYICFDDQEVGYQATDYLIKKNHQNILLITKIDDLQGKYRMKGFMKACEKNNIWISSSNILTYTTETSNLIIDQALAQLEKNPEISAIFCYNDQIANVLCQKLFEKKYRVPDDYSIISVDNSNLSQMGGMSITSLAHPKEELGIGAANWIINAIEKNIIGENINYQPQLIERSSVKEI